jgi:hypothetical protein
MALEPQDVDASQGVTNMADAYREAQNPRPVRNVAAPAGYSHGNPRNDYPTGDGTVPVVERVVYSPAHITTNLHDLQETDE